MAPIGLVCLIANWLWLEWLHRRTWASAHVRREPTAAPQVVVQRDLALKSLCVFTGLLAAFVAGAPMDVASLTAATVLLVWANRPPRVALEAVDWSLLLFFAG
jgi:Na+/H+ antiporter NhaD/arsenite permease-like protein